MQKHLGFSLDEIVNVKVLQEIQDKFAEATGLAAVIVDSEGWPVTNPSNFTRFCKTVRSVPAGLARCMASDAQAGRIAAKTQQPCIYHCHSGLTDLAAPIIVQGQYIGAFLAGQVVVSDDITYDAIGQVRQRAAGLGLDMWLVDELYAEISAVPARRVKAAADLLYIMSNYIIEIGMTNIIQKQLMAEMKAKTELERMLQEAELKTLQSQVNPHFLFNTLNTIASLALLEGAQRTQEIVYALSDLLRTSLRNNQQVVTVREEVKYIQDYLLIQKARFGDRIKSSIIIPEKLLNNKIPFMTLQPFVENAIIHGIEPQKGGGQIIVSGYAEGNNLLLTITDTGIGISQEQVNRIFQEEKRGNTHGHVTGLGIINVHKRIRHHFGSPYGIKIAGQPGKGTRVEILLPYTVEGGNQDVQTISSR
ncbi:sensor histidine kinase [Sporolituus thermophilus]|uniref:histidine kinase n=1 Tax=Sporolituus thermophilus DSM 23256 TaxID=1123285 RepID=A0A1G7M3I4_9FIRM|nr:PocR ligand-binding domain-containing protein [Sporolituus thermophilus]SDF56194.1 Histidine kinase-, DNA gyrase B-, and HSP90-like ATPase [Sporolituus thermophilus DSM 23256]